MTEAEELEWHRNWRRKVRSAFRLWLNATGYQDGCNRLSDLKAVFNERAPEHRKRCPTPIFCHAVSHEIAH